MTALKLAAFLAAIFLVWRMAAGHPQSRQRIEIIAKRFTYDPDVNTLKRGQPVVLVIHSIDVTHGLKVDEWNIKSDEIRKDKDTEIQFYSRRSGSL